MANRDQPATRHPEDEQLEVLGRLAAGTAHDFNNILHAFAAHAELLLQELPPGTPAARQAEQLLRIGEKAVQFTRQLEAIGRRQPLAPRSLDLSAVVVAAGPALSRLVGDGVRLRLHCPAGLPEVQLDARRFEQALQELVGHAHAALPGSAGWIEVETRAVGGAGRDATHVLLSVSDNGTPIAAQPSIRVLEPFHVAGRLGRGTGLGLATAHGFVRQSGGRVEVESGPERTSIRAYFPVAAQADGPAKV